MKTIMPILVFMLAAMPALVLAQPSPDILLFNLPAQLPGYYPAAVNARGYAFTETKTTADFYTALTNGTDWDLVLVDNYDQVIDDATLVVLMNYIGRGGHCALSHYGLDWALANALGANMRLTDYRYTTPIPVLRWEPEHPLLTTPNPIPDLTPLGGDEISTIDGFYLQPQDDATAVAGYTPAAADHQAAIVIGNEGRTILLGLTPGLFGSGMEELLENCIEYLLSPPPPPAPPLHVTCNTLTPAAGSAFTVDVTVQPLTKRFDAWGCIFGPGPAAYSFTLGEPTVLRNGAEPLAQNVPGLPAAYGIRLLDMRIPAGIAGEYMIIVELVPAGLDPLIPIEGYLSIQTVTVH